MRRLYWRIYAGIVMVIVTFALVMGLLFWLDPGRDARDERIGAIAATVAEVLPTSTAPAGELQQTIARLAGRFGADARVYAADGRILASSGAPVPAPPGDGVSGWVHGRDGHAFALALPDGRWLVASRRDADRRGPAWLLMLVLAAVVIAIGAHPLARRITRRLERLQASVEELGAGDLSARVAVEGRDEVARLAGAFNRAAQRIEELVRSQRSTLAGASHELRSPLARIRMAVELAGEGLRADLRTRMERDVEELDGLIEELLLASRLQTGPVQQTCEAVDLGALLGEEAARVDARCRLADARVTGDPRLLRRAIRNLLENAVRHGAGSTVEASLAHDGEDAILLQVADRGPGVDDAWRERIFEPFSRPPGLREGDDPGVGLGLALVRQIAQLHGGDVSCEARDGGGSRFVMRLPAGDAGRDAAGC